MKLGRQFRYDMVARRKGGLKFHPSMNENCQDFLADLMARFGFQTLHHVGR